MDFALGALVTNAAWLAVLAFIATHRRQRPYKENQVEPW